MDFTWISRFFDLFKRFHYYAVSMMVVLKDGKQIVFTHVLAADRRMTITDIVLFYKGKYGEGTTAVVMYFGKATKKEFELMNSRVGSAK